MACPPPMPLQRHCSHVGPHFSGGRTCRKPRNFRHMISQPVSTGFPSQWLQPPPRNAPHSKKNRPRTSRGRSTTTTELTRSRTSGEPIPQERKDRRHVHAPAPVIVRRAARVRRTRLVREPLPVAVGRRCDRAQRRARKAARPAPRKADRRQRMARHTRAQPEPAVVVAGRLCRDHALAPLGIAAPAARARVRNARLPDVPAELAVGPAGDH